MSRTSFGKLLLMLCLGACGLQTTHADDGREEEEDRGPKVTTMKAPLPSDVLANPFALGGPGSGAPPLDTSYSGRNWVSQGPNPGINGDMNMYPCHPVSGCVTAVVPHPDNADILYIGTVNGGVWKTTNATAAPAEVIWKPLTDDMPSLSIGDLVMDPTDGTRNTLVAGIGRKSSLGAEQGGAHVGLLRTTDGGMNWSLLPGLMFQNTRVVDVVALGSVILATTDNGFFRSSDAGATFVLGALGLPGGRVTHLEADPGGLGIYAHVQNVGVYRSLDGGVFWVPATIAAFNHPNVALSAAPGGVVYATPVNGRNNPSVVYRSSDWGGSWTPMDSYLANAAGRHHALLAHPTNPTVVFLAGEYTRTRFPYNGQVARGDSSLPAASQWTSLVSSTPQATTATAANAPHTDSRAMAIDANGDLIEGDDGGIYRLSSPLTTANGLTDGTAAWSNLNGNLQITETHNLAYDNNSDSSIAGSQDNGFLVQGQTFADATQSTLCPATERGWFKQVNGDGGDSAVDVTSLASQGQSIRYMSAQYLGGFQRTVYDANNTIVSGPTTLNQVSNSFGAQFVNPIALNSQNANRLLIGAGALRESLNQGDTVGDVPGGNRRANQFAKMVYGAPGNEDLIYVGVGSKIYRRTTAGGTLAETPTPWPGAIVQGVVQLIDPDWIAAIDEDQVLFTVDGGSSWLVPAAGQPSNVGLFRTLDWFRKAGIDYLVLGTDTGVYITTTNTGLEASWTQVGSNLPCAPAYDLHYDATDDLLAVALFGRGVWTFDFDDTRLVAHVDDDLHPYVPDGSENRPFASVTEGQAAADFNVIRVKGSHPAPIVLNKPRIIEAWNPEKFGPARIGP